MTEKIRIREIQIDGEIENPRTVNTFIAANNVLRRNAETAPQNGGYDKHFLMLVFNDGYEYQARMDVQHTSCDRFESLESHITWHCRFYGGLMSDAELPKHISPKQYRSMLSELADATIQGYVSFLNNYHIGD